MKTAFIVNTIAVKRCTADWNRIADYISSEQDCDIRMTESYGQAVQLANNAVKSGVEMVVAVGGDGTVNEVLNGLFENGVMINKDLTLGIVPLGSGCDFARSLGMPRKTEEIINTLKHGRTVHIDAGKASYVNLNGEKETRYFINMADLGAGGVVVQKAKQAPRIFGKKPNYLWGILAAAVSYKAKTVRFSVDDSEELEVAVRNMVIANGRYFGFGFLPAPHARMNDGLFDIVNIGDFGLFESLWNVPRLYRGTHLGLKKVSSFRGRKVVAASDEKVLLEVDGDLIGTLPATFEIVPDAIKIIAP